MDNIPTIPTTIFFTKSPAWTQISAVVWQVQSSPTAASLQLMFCWIPSLQGRPTTHLLCVSTDSSLLLRRWMWQRWVGRSCSTSTLLFKKMGLGTPWILNLILAISFVFCRPCFGWTNPSKDTPPPAGLVLVFCVPVFWCLVDSGIGERRHSLARGTNSGILCSSVPGSFYLCHYTPQPPLLKFLPPNIFSGKYFKTYVKPSDDLCKVRNDPKKDFTIYPKHLIHCTVLLPLNGKKSYITP